MQFISEVMEITVFDCGTGEEGHRGECWVTGVEGREETRDGNMGFPGGALGRNLPAVQETHWGGLGRSPV